MMKNYIKPEINTSLGLNEAIAAESVVIDGSFANTSLFQEDAAW